MNNDSGEKTHKKEKRKRRWLKEKETAYTIGSVGGGSEGGGESGDRTELEKAPRSRAGGRRRGLIVEEGIGGDDRLLDRGGGDAEGSAAAPLPREKIVEAGSDQPRRHGNRGEEDGPQRRPE